MQCLAICHVRFEDLGVFEPCLRSLGYEVSYRQAGTQPLSAQEWLLTPLVVVLGGPIGVYETADYPWLPAQIEGLRSRLVAGRPTLGLCLGAQLMAAALGARVYPGSTKEIGWGPVQLKPAALGTALDELQGVPVLHWHGDTFDVPDGAQGLASTELTPHQAFAVGRHALALQFHPEVDPARIEEWLIGHGGELAAAGIKPADLRKASEAVGRAPVEAGLRLLKRWLQRAATT